MAFRLTLQVAVAAFLMMWTTVAHATIFTFDNLGLLNFGDIPGAYGDRVSALCDAVGCYGIGNAFTPNVVTDYRSVRISDNAVLFNNLDFWTTDYGDLVNVAFAVPSSGAYGEVALTPDPGFAVRLNSFDVGGWPDVDHLNQPLRILDGAGNILLDLGPTTFLGANNQHSHFDINLTFESTIRIQYGDNWNTGIDNINFDQCQVADDKDCISVRLPGPSPLILMTLGLAGLAFSAWRRGRARR